jgi:hypothetical protein
VSVISQTPWTVKIEAVGVDQQSVKILNATGGVVALMKNGGGRKVANAHLIVEKINEWAGRNE